MRAVTALLCGAILAAASGGLARAAECPPQKISTSVDLVGPPGDVPIAPVTLAGQQKRMIVDTGAAVSLMFRPAVRQLGLQTGVSSTGVITLDGTISTSVAGTELVLGRLRAPNFRFIVSAPPRGGATGTTLLPGDDVEIPDDQPVGLLGAEILQNYDADFDFPGGKLNLIDPDHCKGKVVYWQAKGLAIIPFRMDKAFHITFPVTVDGRKMTAMLDTGASETTMKLNAAQTFFHVDPNAPDMEKVGELRGDAYTASVYRRRFKTITFGDVVVSDPSIMLFPDMTKARLPVRPVTGSLLPERDRAGQEDVVVGMSTLSNLHVYIAYKERNIYITPGAPP